MGATYSNQKTTDTAEPNRAKLRRLLVGMVSGSCQRRFADRTVKEYATMAN